MQREDMLVVDPIGGGNREAAVLDGQPLDIPERNDIDPLIRLVFLEIDRNLADLLILLRRGVAMRQQHVDELVGVRMIDRLPRHIILLEHLIQLLDLFNIAPALHEPDRDRVTSAGRDHLPAERSLPFQQPRSAA